MGLGIGRTLKRIGKSTEKSVKKKAEKAVVAIPRAITDALVPDINIPGPEKEAVMPIPDEELGKAARRRMRARRKGGRSSSILTGGDSLGGY